MTSTVRLCNSIETLAMAYLDDELAAEERRELELHLVDCASCKVHVDAESADLEAIRSALVAPPAPDLLNARIARALDDEDRNASRADRRRWWRHVLPASAVLSAAAALLVFAGVAFAPREQPRHVAAVTQEVIRQENRSLPLEVQGASTRTWLKQHFAPVEPPTFTEPGIQLVGGRATSIAGRDAVLLRYLANVGINRVSLTTVLIADVSRDMFSAGRAVRVGDKTLHLHAVDGMPAVSYIDSNRIGYVFTSERMTEKELLSLVVTSDLIGRAQQQLR